MPHSSLNTKQMPANKPYQQIKIHQFKWRHLGPNQEEITSMLGELGYQSMEAFIKGVVPESILSKQELALPQAQTEKEALEEFSVLMGQNRVCKSFIGLGYYGTVTPPVILRNILENPGWYTQYTPYQAEIAQGRLEALINFQTMVCDLTGFEISNASLLDEATAASEAMALAWAVKTNSSKTIFVADDVFPQTIDVIRSRAKPLEIDVVVAPVSTFNPADNFGLIVQTPNKLGEVIDYSDLFSQAKAAGVVSVVACDVMALALMKTPAEMGADMAIGSTQRFGVPVGFGGPHAAFLATRDEFKRKLPGRLVGVSKDAEGNQAYRLTLQTREQHIRRDKATSNICTAQVLLAVMASMYAVYHGPEGIKEIAQKIYSLSKAFIKGLQQLGFKVVSENVFDTVAFEVDDLSSKKIRDFFENAGINLCFVHDKKITVSFDETHETRHVILLLEDLAKALGKPATLNPDELFQLASFPASLARHKKYLTHGVFNKHHSETEMLRYMHALESKDLSLNFSMIPLGSCTMKLNATSEMMPVTWPTVAHIHPFAPENQWEGYAQMIGSLEKLIAEITGFAAVSFQPNAGSQGEYAGLLAINSYHEERKETHRNICLIPSSAHGTNPASAVMAGLEVVVTKCDSQGNVDVSDLKEKVAQYKDRLSCLMITYPSTHGVFEESIRDICDLVHANGGLVYMDGANMNAQVGLSKPGAFGADVCHLNLHKTFCIPHGGGGPGVGPIAVNEKLAPFLPKHVLVKTGGDKGYGAISAAPFGSASILPISYLYIRMMGGDGLKLATQVAILNANYMAKKLDSHFPVLYKGQKGLVAHECIVDVRQLKAKTGVEVEDIAKRLMDYGFHAPTVSFPVPGTLMIEPTESESLDEINRFCDALISIRKEIEKIETGVWPKDNNPLKNAPHTASFVTKEDWPHPYTRAEAAFPLPWVKAHKFWPAVARIDNVFGDRNVYCTCPPMEEYELPSRA